MERTLRQYGPFCLQTTKIMAKKVFGNDIIPKCAYCERCVLTDDQKTALCEKRGFTTLDGSCKKFVYDPLKRVPDPALQLPDFQEEDFLLESEEPEE